MDNETRKFINESRPLPIRSMLLSIGIGLAVAFLFGIFMAGCATTRTSVNEDGQGGFRLNQAVTTTIGAKQAEGATDFSYEGSDPSGQTWKMGSGSAAKGQEGESLAGLTQAIGGIVLNALGQMRGNSEEVTSNNSLESLLAQFRAMTPEQRATLLETLRSIEH